MPEYTSLAKWTLIVSWTLTALGFLSTSLNVLCARKVGVDVALVVASLVLATVLIALSTWAIVDEGQGMHDQDVSSSQLVHLAKVSFRPHMCVCDGEDTLTMDVVTPCCRGTLEPC